MRPPALLAVHAHPDDETLSTGGLLAAWARTGHVTVVTATRGEQGEVIPPGLAHLEGDGPALAAHRVRELGAALDALGVSDHVFLDEVLPVDGGDVGASRGHQRFVDSGMAWLAPVPEPDDPVGPGAPAPGGRGTGPVRRLAGAAATLPEGAFVDVPVEDAAERLAVVIADRRPDVVVTYEPGGGYGHPDHVRVHEVTMRAVELVTAREGETGGYRPAVLWAVVPEPALRAARAALAGPALRPYVERLRAEHPRLRLPGPDDPMPTMSVPPDQVDLRLDLAPPELDALRRALDAHATQVTAVWVAAAPVGDTVVGCYALSHWTLAPLLAAEYYRCAPGWAPDGPDTPGRVGWSRVPRVA